MKRSITGNAPARRSGRAALPLAPALAWVLASTLCSATAEAALTQWGTFTAGSARICPAGLCSGTFLAQETDGGFLQPFSEVSYTPSGAATAYGVDFGAQATLVGGLALPELKAYAITPADPDRFTASATARGIQGFVFGGAADQAYALDVALTGSVTGFGTLSGFVSVYEADGFDPNGEPIGRALDSTSFFRSSTTTRDPETLDFVLAPGDEVYLYAVLFATSDSRSDVDSSADAFHTLKVAFRDETGLTAASVTPPTRVPAPACGGLLAAACALFLRRTQPRADARA